VFATFQGGNYHHSHLERFVRPLSLRACAGLIVAPQTEAQRVRARYGVHPAKVTRIFNPVDLSVWYPVDRAAARAALGLPSGAQVVAWHGRVAVHKKGLDLLLDAWGRVCRERPERQLRLLLVGTGDEAAELRGRLVASRLPGVIWIDQFLHEPAILRQYLSAADVYAFTSRYEGCPVAPVEAMACGLPIVATDATGLPDILEGGEASGGRLVPREDVHALAREIGRLLDDPQAAHDLGERARHRAAACFSVESVGRQLRDLLLRQLPQPKPQENPLP
jgi:starch synthase